LYLWDKSKIPKIRARLPRWLREHKEEELPEELQEKEVESDGDVSSDGFETDYNMTFKFNQKKKKHVAETTSHLKSDSIASEVPKHFEHKSNI
jgi:uncharacterized protein YdaT